MYEKDIPESCLRAYFLIASRWHLAIVIYQSHAIDPVYRFLRVANTVCCYHPSICLNNLNMLLLDAESKGFTTTTSRKSIDCFRAKLGKISQLHDNNRKENLHKS